MPAFLFSQLFMQVPVAFAQPDTGITVTGTLVQSESESDVSVTNATADAIRATRPRPGGTNQPLIRLNFEGTDLRTVLLYLADITGDTILPDRSVKGEVTVINPKPVTPEEAKEIIFSILEMQGFTVVRYDNLVKIVRAGDAKQRPIETLKPPEEVEDMDTEDIIRTQVIYPKHVSPEDVQKFITPLLTKGAGQIIINKPTRAVLMIDTGANIKRLMRIIDLIDRIIEGGQIDIRIIPLEYADEQEMASMLNAIFNAPAFKDPTAQKVTIGGSAAPAGAKSAPPVAKVAAPEGSTELKLGGEVGTKATFIAEPRLHAMIVIAAQIMFPLIDHIISALDVPSTEKDDTIHIYPLQHAKAEEITATLNDIFSERGDRTPRRPTPTGAKRTSERDEDRRRSARERISRSRPPTRTPTTGRRVVPGSGMSHLAGKVDVLYDEPSNSLIIITSPKYYDAVKRVIERLDQRTPQAWIQAMIVEVSRNKDFNFGVGWKRIIETDRIFGKGRALNLFQALDTTLGPAFDEARREITAANMPGFSYAYGKYDSAGRFDPYMTLQVAEGVKDINVLSTPSILAANNKEAMISIGQQYPIARYSRGTSGETRDFSYEYTDINIELSVTPRINRHREVSLETKVVVKDNGGSAYPTDPTAPPIILDRSAATEVVVQDGQTLIMGGLIKDDFNTTVSKIPLLGDIPVVKNLFRTKRNEKRKVELLIFITPFVVETDTEGDELTTTVRSKYRGANAFVEDRDRALLYDDLNRERSQLTIYDDWREFEKHVEYAENYFNPPAAEDAAAAERALGESRYFMRIEHETEPRPFEGELLLPDEDLSEPPKEDTPEVKGEPAPDTAATGTGDAPMSLSALLDRERLLVERASRDEF